MTYQMLIVLKWLTNIHTHHIFPLYIQNFVIVLHICVVLLCSNFNSYENVIWDKPYSHAAAYVVGAWLGYLLHSQQEQHVVMNRVSNLLATACH